MSLRTEHMYGGVHLQEPLPITPAAADVRALAQGNL
jgi:hypothetical protein